MRLPLRKLVFWLHLGAAVSLGLVILLLAATGLLLAFESQILAWADRDSSRIQSPQQSTEPTAVQDLLGAIAARQPDLPATAVTLKRDPIEATVLVLGREGVVYVDPHRRVVTGQGSSSAHAAMRTITELHRYLGGAAERRPLGKSVTGAANLVFLFVLLSGLYLWVPRVLDRARLRNVVWFRGGLPPKARDLNWHHVLGLWAWAPLVLIVVSALPMSYVWAGDLLLRVTGSPVPAKTASQPAPASAGAPGARSETPAVGLASMDLRGLDRVLERASADTPAWRSITLRLPPSRDGRVNVTVDRSDRRGRPDLRAQLVFDRATGALIESEAFADQSLGRRVRSWMRWIHTGEAGGLAGQIVAASACLAALVLGWTGFALALRRFGAWRRRVAVPATLHSRGLQEKVDA